MDQDHDSPKHAPDHAVNSDADKSDSDWQAIPGADDSRSPVKEPRWHGTLKLARRILKSLASAMTTTL